MTHVMPFGGALSTSGGQPTDVTANGLTLSNRVPNTTHNVTHLVTDANRRPAILEGNGKIIAGPHAGMSLLEWALKYAEHGYHVFPLRPGTKGGYYAKCPRCDARSHHYNEAAHANGVENCTAHPAGYAKCHGLYAATTNPDVIRQWWMDDPYSNIGINCGRSGIVLVDTDVTNGKDGEGKLAELEAAHGTLPIGPHARTSSGGQHRLFRPPTGVTVRNSTNLLATGIDIKATGGLMIAAPSIVVIDKTDHVKGQYVWLNSPWQELPELPGWVLKEIERNKSKTSVPRPASTGPSTPAVDIQDRVTQLADEAASAPQGHRNNILFQNAVKCFEYANAGQIDHDEVEFIFTQAGEHADEDAGQVRATVASARRKAVKEYRWVTRGSNAPASKNATEGAAREGQDDVHDTMEIPEPRTDTPAADDQPAVETRSDFFDRTESLDLPGRKRAARERVKLLAQTGVSEEVKQEERDFLQGHAKLPKGEFNALYESAKKTTGGRAAGGDQEEGFSWNDVFDMPEEARTPNGYMIFRDGVRHISEEGNLVKITFAPLIVTSVFSDAQGNQSAELAWTNFDGKVVRRIVSKGILRRGRKLIEELAEAGLPVIESDSKAVERWLAEFEATNRGALTTKYIARWLGWQPDGSFIASPHGDVRVEIEYDDQKGAATAHRTGGTFQGWKDGVAPMKDHAVPRTTIAAAFAAALLRPLGVPSFTVDIASKSTGGKTTSAQAGLSVWADPSEDAKAITSWRITHISIEKRLNLVRGLVMVLDDTMTAVNEDIINDVLYDLPKGIGKARSGGWPSLLPWETVLISTGERSALSYSTHQGAAARVLCVNKPPLPKGRGDLATALRESVQENHGHAGPAFASKLVEVLAQEGGKTTLRDRHMELTEQLRGSTDMSGRRAPMVAAVALAEQLACEWGILPYEAFPVTAWQAMFTEVDNQTDNRPEMAMEVLRSHVASHSQQLYKPRAAGTQWASTEVQQPTGGWLGLLIKGKDGHPDQVAIHPDKVRKILQTSNYSLDAVLEGWLDAGYLETSKTQRPAHLIPKRMGGGTRVKMLVFTPEAIAMGDETDV